MGALGAAAVAGAGAGRPAGADDKIWYRCPTCKPKFEGNYTRKAILDHEAGDRLAAQKAREAQDRREADRKRKEAAHGRKPGKAKRKFKAHIQEPRG